MSRDRPSNAQLFIGRLPKDVRESDLEKLFDRYGKMTRCDIRSGPAHAYAFIDYEDKRDAEDALKAEDGQHFMGNTIAVEYAKGSGFRFRGGGRGGGRGFGGGGGGGGYGDRRGGGGGRRSPPRRRSRSRSGDRANGGSRRRRSRSDSGSRSPQPARGRAREDSRSP